jgi:hypothetical protein
MGDLEVAVGRVQLVDLAVPTRSFVPIQPFHSRMM